MMKILFVCLGNICRSPLAQGVFEKEISEQKIEDHFYADSAGTSGWHQGEKPHYASINIAQLNGIDLSKQRSRQVLLQDKDEFDYFIPMDESNKISLIHEFGFPADRVIKIRFFDIQAKDADVPDPYGQGIRSFENVFNMLDRSIKELIGFLGQENSNISSK